MRLLLIPVLALSVATGLSGCLAGGIGPEAELQASRALARTAVNAAVAQRLPGVDATPVTDCVINNATTDELLNLGRAAGTSALGGSVDGQAWSVVTTVAQRPATLQCLSSSLSTGQLLSMGGALL